MLNVASFRYALLVAAFFLSSLLSRRAVAQDDVAAQPDHPLVVVAVASADRLLDRAVDVMQLNEIANTREEVIALIKKSGMMQGLEDETPLQWYDLTKPVGMMYFFDGTLLGSPAAAGDQPKADDEGTPAAASGPLETMLQAGLSPKRFVAFFPVKDYQQFLTLGKLEPVAGKANCFRDDKGVEQYLRRFGRYVVTGQDGDVIDHCPDPRDLARGVLGKNDVAVSLQLKGLPPLLRMLGAEGIKTVYDASLQRRDNEPDRDYRLRRALGDISRELLDLAMTQIDEVTLGFRIEAGVRSIIDLEWNGTDEGKLAKFAAEMTPKKSTFEPLWNAEYDQSLALSLALPQRHTKPLAAAIRNYVATATEAGELETIKVNGPLINVGCRLLETNQFELLCTGEREGDVNISLYGLRIPTDRNFPQQFETFIRAVTKDDALGVTTTTLDDLPVYQIKTIPFLPQAFGMIFSQAVGAQGDSGDVEIPCNSWLIATPNAVWLCSRPDLADEAIPTLLHRAIDIKTQVSPDKGKRVTVAPFRMSLHPGHWKSTNPDAEGDNPAVDGKPNPEREQQLAQREKLQKLYDAHPDGISVELLPTARGLKLTMGFDAVYALLVPQLFRETITSITRNHSVDDSRSVVAGGD